MMKRSAINLILFILLLFSIQKVFSQRDAGIFFSKKEQNEIKHCLNIPKEFTIEKIFLWKIFGNEEVYVISIVYDGSGANYPFKGCVIMNSTGTKLISIIKSKRFYLKKILQNQLPFLIVEECTSKGNGWHRILGMENKGIKNFLNLINDRIHTIDEYYDKTVFEPHVMRLNIKDINKDGFSDIVFTTTLKVIEQNGIEKKMKLNYVFLYIQKKKLFLPKNNYFHSNYY